MDNKFVVGVISWLSEDNTKPIHVERLKMNAFTIVKCATVEQYKVQFNKLTKSFNMPLFNSYSILSMSK